MSALAEIVTRGMESDRPALLGERPASHKQLIARASVICAALVAEGAGPGQLVVVALPQGAENIATILAVNMAGAVVVPINPLATAAELEHILTDCGAQLLIVPPEHVRARKVDPNLGIAIAHTAAAAVFTPAPTDEFVVYTSGSTGRPKGVILSSGAVAANLRAVSEVLGLTEEDRTLAFTPPQYTLALSQVFSHLWSGAAVLPIARALLDPLATFLRARDEGITGLQLNPGILRSVIQTLGRDFPQLSLRYVLLLGQPVSRSFATELRGRFSGVTLFNGYGCTENAPRVAMGPIGDKAASDPLPVGKAVPGTELSIRDDDGNELPPGVRGEICIRGNSLMRGYLNAEAATRDRFVSGWFRTRDVGELSESGELLIAGRLDNIILVSHEKVSPEDIEEEVARVAGVNDVAVAGVSDVVHFQVPVALIVAESLDVIAEAKRHLRSALSRSKQPARYHLVEAIPRTPYGKIDRAALRELVAAMEDGRGGGR